MRNLQKQDKYFGINPFEEFYPFFVLGNGYLDDLFDNLYNLLII